MIGADANLAAILAPGGALTTDGMYAKHPILAASGASQAR